MIGAPLVGAPVVWAMGFVVLVLVTFPSTSTWVGSLVTVAHEGAHVIMAILTGRGPKGFKLNETTGGGVTPFTGGWGVGPVLIWVVGYLTPPLAGLAGASLVLAGQSWSLLWVAIILLLGAWAQFTGLFTGLVVLLAGAGIGYVAVEGTPEMQAALAVALVWIMLLGGIRSLANLGWGGGDSDPAQLARFTWIPGIVWIALFWFVGIICLWAGARRLLGL